MSKVWDRSQLGPGRGLTAVAAAGDNLIHDNPVGIIISQLLELPQ